MRTLRHHRIPSPLEMEREVKRMKATEAAKRRDDRLMLSLSIAALALLVIASYAGVI